MTELLTDFTDVTLAIAETYVDNINVRGSDQGGGDGGWQGGRHGGQDFFGQYLLD